MKVQTNGSNNVSITGAWVRKNKLTAKRKRPSKHERLLKALLSCMVVIRPKVANSYLKVDSFGIRLKPGIEYALISIKERMEKKGTNV